MFTLHVVSVFVFFFKQKTAYEVRISDWSSDVCSSDLMFGHRDQVALHQAARRFLGKGERVLDRGAILGLYPPLAHLGLVIVPPGYADPVMYAAGTPYGATSISGQNATPPTDADLAAARFQGRRVAEVAAVLAPLRGKAAGSFSEGERR